MAMGGEYKIRITADGKAFANEARVVVDELNNKIPRAAEHGGGDIVSGIGKGMKHNLRHLGHVAALFGGIFGGLMGEQIGKTFSGKAKEAIHGAMGGLFAGMMFGPQGAAIGALAGGIIGLVTGGLHEAAEEMKRLNAIADKFHIPLEDVMELSRVMDDEHLTKTLEGWNKLFDGIITKAPNVIQALKDVGITGSQIGDVLKGPPVTSDVTFGITGKILDALNFKGFPALRPEDVNKALKLMSHEDMLKTVNDINTLVGGMDKFIELQNKLKHEGPGKPLSYFFQMSGEAADFSKNQLEAEQDKKALDKEAAQIEQSNAEKLRGYQYESMTYSEKRLAMEKEIQEIRDRAKYGPMDPVTAAKGQSRIAELQHGLGMPGSPLPQTDSLSKMGLYLSHGVETYARIAGGQNQMINKLEMLHKDNQQLIRAVSNP